jgi:hypothetical protein
MPSRSRSRATVTREDPFAGLRERLDAVEVVHKESDSGWSLWNEVSQLHESRFAPTLPGLHSDLDSLAIPPEERAWSDTQPAPGALKPVPAAAQAATRPAPGPTLEEALRLTRRNQRVCPHPEHWERLAALLPARQTKGGARPPPRPITGEAWAASPTRAKRACLLEQLEWASRTGVLAQVVDLLQALPEEDWLHIGEH